MSKRDDAEQSFTKRVLDVWEKAKADPVFRKRLLADPEETLQMEGFNENDDDFKTFVSRLKTVDPEALEAGFQSDAKHPTC